MPSFSNGRIVGRNVPEDGAQSTLLHEHVDAETGDVAEFEGKVTFSLFLEVLPLGVVHHVVDQRVCFVRGKGRMIEFLQIAVNTNHRWFAGADVTVGGAFLYREGQQLGNIHRP